MNAAIGFNEKIFPLSKMRKRDKKGKKKKIEEEEKGKKDKGLLERNSNKYRRRSLSGS